MNMAEELSKVLPGLESWAKKHSGAHYDAEDLLVDTVIDILEHPWKWKPERGSLRNLMFSMLRNRSTDAIRTYNRDFRKRFREVIRYRTPFHLVTLPDEEPVTKDLKGKLERCLHWMPIKMAEAFRLVAFEGKSIVDAAQILSLSAGNVKTLLYRARARLQSFLESA